MQQAFPQPFSPLTSSAAALRASLPRLPPPVRGWSERSHHAFVRCDVWPAQQLDAVGDGAEHLVKGLTDGLGLAR